MQLFQDILSRISPVSEDVIGVNISSCSFMEVIQFNVEYKEIKNYIKVPIKYSQVQRELDLTNFETSLLSALSNFKILPNTPICLSLPNVILGITDLPSDLDNEEVITALTSDVERNYLFKKTEPSIGFKVLNSNSETLSDLLIYSAFPESQIVKIDEIFTKNGYKLLSIDNSYFAFLRGIAISGILANSIENENNFAIITIFSNNIIIGRLEGSSLKNIIEIPIATKSIDESQKYIGIASAISEKIIGNNFQQVYIASETSDIAAKELKDHLKLTANTYFIDDNKLFGKELFKYSSANNNDTISPEVVGTACWGRSDIDISMNFSMSDTAGDLYGPLASIGVKKVIHLYLVLIFIASILFIIGLKILTIPIIASLESELNSQENMYMNLKRLDVPETKTFDLRYTVMQSHENNKKLVDSFDALGASIPERVWVTSFYLDNNLNTNLKGKAYEIGDIVTYYENLTEIGHYKNFKIKSIKVINDNTSNSYQESDINIVQNGESFDLPTPPSLSTTDSTNSSFSQRYYEFIFGNIEHDSVNNKNESENFIKNLPDFAKNIILGN